MPTKHLGALLVALVFGAQMSGAQPMSAIDWLTDSVAIPPSILPKADDIATGTNPDVIRVSPIDAPSIDDVGLKDPVAIGLNGDLWNASDQDTLTRLITRTEVNADTPAIRRILIDLLSISAVAPAARDVEGEFLLARVDKLLELGALDPALRMLAKVEFEDPRIFKRWFDIRLLMGTEDIACERLLANPTLSPTFPTTIFCLAREGEWDAAALTLDTAEALGLISAAEDALLLRFLDGSNAEENGPLTLPSQITPLTFRLYQAVGEPISTKVLPRAFSIADLAPQNGWKSRLEAAERLTAAGVLDQNVLFDLYREQQPAASGGVWDRARAVQDLDQVLANPDADASNALRAAWSSMTPLHLGGAFAQAYGGSAFNVNLDEQAEILVQRIRKLFGFATTTDPSQITDPLNRFIYFLPDQASGVGELPNALAGHISDGLSGGALPHALNQLIEDGRTGEATLIAINLFNSGADGDANDLTNALRLLSALGLHDVAKRASIELLVQERRG